MSTIRSLAVLALLVAAAVQPGRCADADALATVQRLYYSGQAVQAMQRLDEALGAQPKDPQLRFLKAVMLADAKRDGEAIELLHAISQDYPDLAEPYNNLAVLHAAAGDFAGARAALEQALRNNPGYATAHENMGDVHAALAAQSYARALQLEPRSTTAAAKLRTVRELYQRPLSGAADLQPRSPS
jgi:tetratricopeptide (TPR) repeat protein